MICGMHVLETPWMPDGYYLALGIRQPNLYGSACKDSAFTLLQSEEPGFRGLQVTSVETGEIISVTLKGFFGLAVFNRSAGAVLEYDSTTWINPTIHLDPF